MAFAEMTPYVVLSPIAGAMADRFDRLWIARLSNAGDAVQAVVLTLLTLAGWMTVEILFVLTLIYGTASAFYQPVRQALVPMLVPREDIPAAVAIASISWHISRFIGPAIAGILIVWDGVVPAFAFAALTYAPFLWVLWRISPEPQALAKASEKGIGGDIFAGYRYALTHPGIGPLLILILTGAFFLRPILQLLPGFAEGVYGEGAAGLAWMTSMAGIAATMAGLWLAQRGDIAGLTRIAIVCMIGTSIMVLAFTAAPNFIVAVACLFVIGFLQVTTGVSIQTLIQSSVERTMLGRVLSLYGLFWLGGTAVGSLIVGWLSSIFGMRGPPAVTAVLGLVVGLVIFRRRRSMARALEHEQPRR